MFVTRSLSFHLYPCSFLRPIGTPFSARSLLFARFHHSTYVCFAPGTIAASLCLCKTARPVSARTACPPARATRAFFAPIGRYADPLWGWICAWWRGARQGRASTGRVTETLRYERSGSLKILGIFRSRYTLCWQTIYLFHVPVNKLTTRCCFGSSNDARLTEWSSRLIDRMFIKVSLYLLALCDQSEIQFYLLRR